MSLSSYLLFFFFNDTATTEIYTLSLHDALPISIPERGALETRRPVLEAKMLSATYRVSNDNPRSFPAALPTKQDRKSTRLNSSHGYISYAVFCLKKKKNISNDDLLNDVLAYVVT